MLLTDSQRFDWLRLTRSEGVGPRTFRALVNRYGGARAALEALPSLGARSGKTIVLCSVADAEREMAQAARIDARFVALGERDYPAALAQIADPPPLIALRGAPAILARPAVSIVGSRNASALGLRMTEILAHGVGEHGYAIVSGLARGIDAKAHEAALATGTIAVLAGGHARIYPPENEPLAEAIIERGGAVLSEMPIGWTPRGRDFPRRNRIVSGLSLATVVVEAARKSGSLITARFALDQGREVFAVPGSPLDPRAEGTNDLIRQGASLAADPDHIVSALAPLLPPEPQFDGLSANSPLAPRRKPLWDELDLPDLGADLAAPEFPGWEQASEGPAPDLSPPDSKLLGALSVSPVDIDSLARLVSLPVREVQAALAELELAGRVTRDGLNRVSLPPEPRTR
ncbi:MAG: DNA protecting protein DprA [Rhizobiales bacterium 65-9]|nr:DNA-processing protein DprA [Hyphomicrobiales bacterium]OJY34046.1 MAG: DNA protecting protein DprA [Rhizobiales bacterium 65-9]